MGIRSVVAYSQADRDSLPVRMADDHVCIGPPPARESYLNVRNLVTAAVLSHCDAVHPGVGFLAENAEFAREVRDAGLIFVGPDPEVIELLGDKIRAKRSARDEGIPVIPGQRRLGGERRGSPFRCERNRLSGDREGGRRRWREGDAHRALRWRAG